MWLNGYFMSSAAATILIVIRSPSSPSSASAIIIVRHRRMLSTVCSPPPFSLPAAVWVIHHWPAIVVLRPCRLSCSCIVSRGLKISSNIYLPRPVNPTILLFWPRRTPVPNYKETTSAVIKVILTSSSPVGLSARQGIEHDRTLSHYYVLVFIHTFASIFALPAFTFYN